MTAHRSTTPSLQSERRDKFDRIVIETTGLANPAPIIQTFFIEESVATNMRLDGVVTLVSLVGRRGVKVALQRFANHISPPHATFQAPNFHSLQSS